MERLLTASVSWVVARTSIQVILQNVVESLGFRPHTAAANQEFARGKAGAEGALKKPLTPCPAIFTFREPPGPLSLLLVPLPCAHSLLSHASFKEYVFILSTSPALKWEFFGFHPACLSQSPEASHRRALKYPGESRETKS